jgi:hypothetical protein
VIAAPHTSETLPNALDDDLCLGAITEEAARLVRERDPALLAAVEPFDSTDDLAAALRAKPQRDDEGIPCDGPKVAACRPAQRLRLFADDPNCVERSFDWVVGAELLDPGPVRRLATVETSNGLHVFPTEDGEPVILDPTVSRNALRAALFRAGRNALRNADDVAIRRLRLERLMGTDETKGTRGDLARARASKAQGYTTWVNGEPIDEAIAKYESTLAMWQAKLDELPRNAGSVRNAGPVTLTPSEAVEWIAQLAADPALRFKNGARRARNGAQAIRGVLVGRPICVADVRDVAFVLALADREARHWGPAGQRVVRTCAHAIEKLDQAAAQHWLDERAPRNAPELRIGGTRIMPNIPLLAALGRITGRLGTRVGIEALRLKLATMGVTPPVLNTIEQELQREGLSLGALAAPPPMPGTLRALTPEVLAGHYLARKL